MFRFASEPKWLAALIQSAWLCQPQTFVILAARDGRVEPEQMLSFLNETNLNLGNFMDVLCHLPS